MGLPLINYIVQNDFKGPMVFGIEFVKVNLFGFFAEITSKFSKQTSPNISDVEIWLNRPAKWTYVSVTTFFRAVEVVAISKPDKIEEEYR
jgi:hypothetical protein